MINIKIKINKIIKYLHYKIIKIMKCKIVIRDSSYLNSYINKS
jgi:hypothetical protein